MERARKVEYVFVRSDPSCWRNEIKFADLTTT